LLPDDQVWEVTLDLVTLVLREINPEETALLYYSFSEFHGGQLADLG